MSVYAHVGVPKTATSALQSGIFPYVDGMHYLGKPYWNESLGLERSVDIHNTIERIWNQDSLRYCVAAEEAKVQAAIFNQLDECENFLLSEEGLTNAGYVDRGLIAERLKRVLKVDRVLITIREQGAALRSLYYWYYARGIVHSASDDWLRSAFISDAYRGGYPDFPARQYCYSELLSTYEDVFGANNVTVLPVELLALDRQAYMNRLSEFLEVDGSNLTLLLDNLKEENRTRSTATIWLQRRLHGMRKLAKRGRPNFGEYYHNGMAHHFYDSGIVHRLNRSLDMLSSRPRGFGSNLMASVRSYYETGNLEVANRQNLDLERLGYAVK